MSAYQTSFPSSDEDSYFIEVHYDVELDPEPKEKHSELNRDLFEQIKDFFSKNPEPIELKYDQEHHSITLESEIVRLHTWVGSEIHFVVQFVKNPSQELLLSVNDFSSKILGFATSRPGVKVKECDTSVSIKYVLKDTMFPRFINPSGISDLNSKLKTTMKPIILAFFANIQEMDVGVTFADSPKTSNLEIVSHIEAKEPPYDYISKFSQKLNKVGDEMIHSLGVEIAST